MPRDHWFSAGQIWVLVGFHVLIFATLAVDLGAFRRKTRTISTKEAAIWSGLWIFLSLTFAAAIAGCWRFWRPEEPNAGPERALEFLTGYLIEKSLSIDNLFVFLVIFRYFAVPAHLQHRVLVWGVVGALVLRAGMILGGAALLMTWHWLFYVLGAFLIYSGGRLATSREEIDPGRNYVLRLAKRIFRIEESYDSNRFWVRREGHWFATQLPLVVLVVESTDIMFAVDSIPAVFAVSNDPFIVYTSNIFALMGLRALYFLLADFLARFRYMNIGLGIVLAFVGGKMLIQDWFAIPIPWALGSIATILTLTVAASVFAGRDKPPKKR